MYILDLIMDPTPSPQPSFISKHIKSGQYLFADLTISDNMPFSIVCAGREECAANYETQRSEFSYFAIECIAHGQWMLESDQGNYEIGPGYVFAYSPETSYRLRPIDDQHLVKFFVDFQGIGSHQKIRDARLDFGVPVLLINTRWIHDIFDQILALSSAQRAFTKSAGTLLTELMFMRVKEDRLNVSGTDSHAHVTYMRCRRYMLKQFANITRIEEVASASHVDAAYLSRLFKRFAGETPYQFLIRLKMASAAEILLAQNTTVKNVAAQVSFDDPYHFSRVFKARHGLSPKHFVKKVQRGG